jgi:hypothetical protein
MILLEPKTHFLEGDSAIVKELAKVVQSANFHHAIVFAIGEYVSTRSHTAEQLYGVNEFVNVLLNLPFKEEPVKSQMAKTLDHSVFAGLKPPTK